ncbi:hypothetical protein DERP_003070 [Dermatophagoides pteronyssinus]|uniref:Uncharacterized protein n=1 Tax=Dermatophagoides pteronyssinus TaxID=6956 RepID=A0ABQ8JIH6_DERPT|nr:hypothetical protein DERP_003070 [Dermatophagoides pteronyssinus]
MANHKICTYLDDRFSSKILSINYHRKYSQLWLITDDSYLHRLSRIKTKKNNKIIKWNYKNMISEKILIKNTRKIFPLKHIEQIQMMFTQSTNYFFLIQNENYENITAYILNENNYLILSKMDPIYWSLKKKLFIVDIDYNRLLIFEKDNDKDNDNNNIDYYCLKINMIHQKR